MFSLIGFLRTGSSDYGIVTLNGVAGQAGVTSVWRSPRTVYVEIGRAEISDDGVKRKQAEQRFSERVSVLAENRPSRTNILRVQGRWEKAAGVSQKKGWKSTCTNLARKTNVLATANQSWG